MLAIYAAIPDCNIVDYYYIFDIVGANCLTKKNKKNTILNGIDCWNLYMLYLYLCFVPLRVQQNIGDMYACMHRTV